MTSGNWHWDSVPVFRLCHVPPFSSTHWELLRASQANPNGSQVAKKRALGKGDKGMVGMPYQRTAGFPGWPRSPTAPCTRPARASVCAGASPLPGAGSSAYLSHSVGCTPRRASPSPRHKWRNNRSQAPAPAPRNPQGGGSAPVSPRSRGGSGWLRRPGSAEALRPAAGRPRGRRAAW